jgi:hypothetical protein
MQNLVIDTLIREMASGNIVLLPRVDRINAFGDGLGGFQAYLDLKGPVGEASRPKETDAAEVYE